MKETISSFNGKILGTVETLSNGDIEVRNYAGVILARYSPRDNYTRNFNGVIITKGNTAAGFLLPK